MKVKVGGLFVVLYHLFFSACSVSVDQRGANGIDSLNSSSVSFEVISVEGGWGYDIYKDGKIYVHHNGVPAISGNSAFETEEKAMRAANFVVNKIIMGVIPPSVTIEELDSLGVLSER